MIWELRKLWGNRSFLRMVAIALAGFAGMQWISQEQSPIQSQGYQILAQQLNPLPLAEQEQWLQQELDHVQNLRIAQTSPDDDNEGFVEQWSTLQKELADKTYPRYGKTIEADQEILQEQYQHLQSVKQYEKRQREIQQAATDMESVSLFRQSQQDMENIEKTAQDHAPLADLVLSFQITAGWEEFLLDPLGGLWMLALMIPLVYWIFLYEQEHSLQYLIRSTANGQYRMVGMRMGCFAISTLAMLLLILLIRYLFCVVQYPMCDASLPLQTLPDFRDSIHLWSIQEYMIRFIAVKWLMTLFFGMTLAFLLRKCRFMVLGTGAFLLLLGIEWLAYTQLTPNGPLAFFHYVNVWVWLEVHPLFAQYQNLLLFQHAYSLDIISFIWACGLGVLMFWLEGAAYVRGVSAKCKHPVTFSVAHRIPNSLGYYHAYRWLWSSKALLLILGALWFYSGSELSFSMTSDQVYQKSMIDEINQLDVAQQMTFMEQQQKHFDDLNEKVEEINKQRDHNLLTPVQASSLTANFAAELRFEPVFQKVKGRWNEIQEQHKSLVFEDGVLMYRQGLPMLEKIVLLAMVGLLIPTLIWKDKKAQLKMLLESTSLGREHRYHYYLLMASGIAISLVVLTQLRLFIAVTETYGAEPLFTNIGNVSVYETMPISMPVFIFFLVDVLVRCLWITMCSYLLLIFADHAKSWATYLLPMILLLFGGLLLELVHIPIDFLNMIWLYESWLHLNLNAVFCICIISIIVIWYTWRSLADPQKYSLKLFTFMKK